MFKLDKRKIKRRLVPSKNHFLSLAGSIIYQQISTKAGDAIYKRFIALFGRKKPSPELLLFMSESTLRSVGLSSQKISYLGDLAQKFKNKSLSNSQEYWNRLNDEEVKESLVRVKGVGPWTADMFLIFALNRPNVLPIGDLGIKNGFKKVFGLRNLPSEKKMMILAKPHTGKWTLLALFLWQSLDEN